VRIVFIPGLGYDSQIFKNLDLSGLELENLNWIEPLPKEKFHDYALRLFSKTKKYSEKTILIGHSLGGAVSQEIASVHQIEKIILISSIKSRKELPFSLKLVKPLRVYKLFTKEISLRTIRFWGATHGFENDEEKNLFKNMVSQHSNAYLQWALRSLSSWRAPNISTEIIHIHGTKDKTLPFKLIKKPDYIIRNGSHICVLKKAEEITRIIKKFI